MGLAEFLHLQSAQKTPFFPSTRKNPFIPLSRRLRSFRLYSSTADRRRELVTNELGKRQQTGYVDGKQWKASPKERTVYTRHEESQKLRHGPP
ncbi:hypothetical protein JCM8097_001081 [Rhodosporidiobolus ruineniae]